MREYIMFIFIYVDDERRGGEISRLFQHYNKVKKQIIQQEEKIYFKTSDETTSANKQY